MKNWQCVCGYLNSPLDDQCASCGVLNTAELQAPVVPQHQPEAPKAKRRPSVIGLVILVVALVAFAAWRLLPHAGGLGMSGTVRYGVGHEAAISQLEHSFVEGKYGFKVPVSAIKGTPQSVSSSHFTFEIYYNNREMRDGYFTQGVTSLSVYKLDENGTVVDTMHAHGSASLKGNGKAGKTGLRWDITLADGPGDYWIPVSGSELDFMGIMGGQQGALIRYR